MKKELEPKAFLDRGTAGSEAYDWEFLPVADVNSLKNLAELYKNFPDEFDIDLFFSMALDGYYSPLWDGMDSACGHIIYRLSDFVPKEQRETIAIYPSESGSIVTEEGVVWDSLEDWRGEWKQSNVDIPHFQKQLKTNPVMKELQSFVSFKAS